MSHQNKWKFVHILTIIVALVSAFFATLTWAGVGTPNDRFAKIEARQDATDGEVRGQGLKIERMDANIEIIMREGLDLKPLPHGDRE